jgi:hypothetical protein
VINGRLRVLLEKGLQLLHERVHPCPPLFFGFRGLQPVEPFPQRDLDGSFGAFTRQTREVFNELNKVGATVSTVIGSPLREDCGAIES